MSTFASKRDRFELASLELRALVAVQREVAKACELGAIVTYIRTVLLRVYGRVHTLSMFRFERRVRTKYF